MRRLSRNYLCVLVFFSALFAAPPATWADRADALYAVLVLRGGGCGGVHPAAQTLRPNALLDRTAADWAEGQSLSVAAEHAGVAAQIVTGLHVNGPESSVVQQLRRSSCRMLMSQSLRAMGVYQRGRDTWIVLASAPSEEPAGAAIVATAQGYIPLPTRPLAQQPRPTLFLATRALQLVNDVRARGTRCGERSFPPAPPVTLSQILAGVASGHAVDMADHSYFEHEDLSGRSPADRVRAVGYREKLVGENIAYGPKSIEEVVQGWLDSPSHCENIMDARFAQMGIAYAAGNASKRGLYWVQLFAAPRV
jgi:uncharacterized protein YkwD